VGTSGKRKEKGLPRRKKKIQDRLSKTAAQEKKKVQVGI